MDFIAEAVVFFGAAIVTIPLAKRLGLGSVLGYLLAGIIIGPSVFALIGDVRSVLHFAELGVVLLLFIIGLELKPKRLWSLKHEIFGLGIAQVVTSAFLIFMVALFIGFGLAQAIVIGCALGLSSTAFALQSLAENNELTTRHGRSAFAILLFQDLFAVPLIAVVPLLSVENLAPDGGALGADLIKVVIVVVGVILLGRLVLRKLFNVVASTRNRELFTALSLFVVAGTAMLLEGVGLSMGLGAFLAGVLLADSEYRHAVEADIEPFKGLLLGLFFMAVGMSIELSLIAKNPLTIFGFAILLMVLKFVVLYFVGLVAQKNSKSALKLAAYTSQGGEFAFVVFNIAGDYQLFDQETSSSLLLIVTLSMILTPLLVALVKRIVAAQGESSEQVDDDLGEYSHPVIIAGFGRFGQITGRILRAKQIGFIALDSSASAVNFVRGYGSKTYYGDASRLDVLRAAGAQDAKLFVLAINDVEASVRTARTVISHFPKLKLYARARNRKHAYQLMELGVHVIERETFAASLNIARQVLEGLDFPVDQAARTVLAFKDHDEQRLLNDFISHDDEEKMQYLAKKSAAELEELFAKEFDHKKI